MRPKIEIKYPDGNAETVTLSRERTIIGRSPNADIRINDNRVSREHCKLEVEGDRVFVTDLGGSNGTWVGTAKLLANVREPFPQEAVLHVGPAQLRNVTARLDPANDLESQAYMPVAPARPSAASAAAPPPARPQQQSAASIELEQGNLSLNPGERGSLLLHISNQSKIVDHYTLSVSGAPTTWVTVPRAGLELLPRESGTLNIDLHPPRHTRTSAGRHPLSIALLNRQKQMVAETTAQLEIGAFDNLSLDIRPNPYESRSGGELTLTVENQGNAQTDYRVSVIEPSDALIITVDPPTAQVAPQQSRQSIVRLKPRKRHWIGQPKRMPLTVTVTSNLQTVSAMPVYTQLSMVPTWLPIILAMACCVLVPLFSLMALNPIRDEYNTRNTAQAATLVAPQTFAAATLTAVPTATPAPDTGATATAEWRTADCSGDGLTNGEKLDRGLDPCALDSDGDGLNDVDEIRIWGTDPLRRDTSGDGLLDGEVVWWKENGEPREWYSCLDPNTRDANGDGIPNGVHIANGTNPCGGAAPTATPAPTPVRGFALGGQVRGPDNLPVAQQAGMSWVKVQLRYSPGANVESTVRDFEAYKGFKLLVSVVGHKEDIIAGGPAFFNEFANFVAQLAFVADAIEIWNEPNIDKEWPEGQISPQMYTQLLQASYTAIKSRNQTTIVISGAPAPTGFFGGGCTANGCDDDAYIRGMMAAGARNYMDCIGIHFNAGATPPNETTGHPADGGQGHYSWYFMPMLNLYWDTFNPPGTSREIPLCFTEIGFLSDEGFPQTLDQLGATNFAWARGNTVFNQAIWLSDALQRACYSGKVKLFIVWNVDFTETYSAQDPQGGYAIMRPNGSCPSCNSLNEAMINLRVGNCV
jgi:hypothetical protein